MEYLDPLDAIWRVTVTGTATPISIIIVESNKGLGRWLSIGGKVLESVSREESIKIHHEDEYLLLAAKYTHYHNFGLKNFNDCIVRAMGSHGCNTSIIKLYYNVNNLRTHDAILVINSNTLDVSGCSNMTVGLNCKKCKGYYPYAESSSPGDFTCTSCNSYREMVMG